MAIDRRSVIGLLVGGAAGTLFTPIPWKSTDDISIWSQNWPWIPRIPGYGDMELVPSVSKLDSSGGAVRVLTVDGVPVNVYGDPDNPLSKGGLSPLAASETQLLYSPSRVQGPMVKKGEGFEPISWDEAVGLLAGKLKDAGAKAACISGDENGTAAEVFSGLMAAAGSTQFSFMPSEGVEAARALNKLGGKGQIGYDLEAADLVLAVGADVFQSFGAFLANAGVFDASKPVGRSRRLDTIYCGPLQNRTAAVCEKFVPLAPGKEAALLAALGQKLGASFAAATAPDAAAAAGIDQKALDELAAMLSRASKPVIIAGATGGAGGGQACVMAAVALNLALGAPIKQIPDAPVVVKGAMARSQAAQSDIVAEAILGGAPAPQVLLVHDANPAYGLPQAGTFTKALADAGTFVVSFSSFMDETAAMADLILPDSRPLEKHDDVYSPYGVGKAIYTAVKPVAKPVCDVKPAADVALAVAAKMGKDLGFTSFKDVLAAKGKALGAKGFGKPMEAEAQRLGGLRLAPGAIAWEPATDGLLLAVDHEVNLGSAKVAIPPMNVSSIRDDQLYFGTMFVRMNGATAAAAGVEAGQDVTLKSAAGTVAARITIDETVMNNVIVAPRGFGHTAWDEYSKDKGENVNALVTVTTEPGTGAPMWAATPVEIA